MYVTCFMRAAYRWLAEAPLEYCAESACYTKMFHKVGPECWLYLSHCKWSSAATMLFMEMYIGYIASSALTSVSLIGWNFSEIYRACPECWLDLSHWSSVSHGTTLVKLQALRWPRMVKCFMRAARRWRIYRVIATASPIWYPLKRLIQAYRHSRSYWYAVVMPLKRTYRHSRSYWYAVVMPLKRPLLKGLIQAYRLKGSQGFFESNMFETKGPYILLECFSKYFPHIVS